MEGAEGSDNARGLARYRGHPQRLRGRAPAAGHQGHERDPGEFDAREARRLGPGLAGLFSDKVGLFRKDFFCSTSPADADNEAQHNL